MRASLGVVGHELRRLSRRWRRSLQLRTLTVTVLVIFVAVWIIGIFVSNQIAYSLFQEQLKQAQTNAGNAVKNVQSTFDSATFSDQASLTQLAYTTLSSLSTGDQSTPLPFVLSPLSGQANPLSITSVATPNYTTTLVPDQLKDRIQDAEIGAQYWQSTSLQVIAGQKDPAIVIGTKVTLSNTKYSLYLFYNLSPTQGTLNFIQSVLWISGAVLLLLIGSITWYVTRNVVKPVSQAALVAEKLAAGQLQERMNVGGEDEVARLATSFNRMAEALQDQITQLATLSRMQQSFVSDVSHELRTPLTTVAMAAEVLHDARGSFDPINQRSAELLYNQVARFQELLADLLEISRFDAGAAVLDAEAADLAAVVDKVVAGAQPLADRIGSQLQVIHLVPADAMVVEMDPRRIERIVRNLVVNALEHGESRPVEIYVATDAEVASVAVRDHGIGMDHAALSRVFDRFWRADPARARTTGGSGLGLSIATEDTRLHNGALEVWGKPNEGSCFRLTIPLERLGTVTHSPIPLPPDGGPGNTESMIVSMPQLDPEDASPSVPEVFLQMQEGRVDSPVVERAATRRRAKRAQRKSSIHEL